MESSTRNAVLAVSKENKMLIFRDAVHALHMRVLSVRKSYCTLLALQQFTSIQSLNKASENDMRSFMASSSNHASLVNHFGT